MPDTSPILRLLYAVRRRLRGNRLLQALVDGATWVLGTALVLTLWNALMPEAWALSWWVYAAGFAAALAPHLSRLRRSEPLSGAAHQADGLADLHDELTSAYWFSRQGDTDEWVDLHLTRAADTARGLTADRLVPWSRPRRLTAPALLAVGLTGVLLLPVPRVFDNIVERLSEIALGSQDEAAEEPLAALEELGDRATEPETPEQDEELLVPMAEEAEAAGEDAMPEEEGQLQESEQQEGETAESEQPGDQPQQGEQTDGEQQQAQDPQDMQAQQDGEASPEAKASQEDGNGESTDQEGPMLPGGEEVFLQEGGEDVEQQQQADEEMGHATREGGGEEELELGELTTLEVQLEREILGVPEEEADPESEDKEELVTRAEQSFLDYEEISPPDDFAAQELLQAESIPWRYRRLVLSYFKTLRERDNQQQEQDRE